MKIRILIIYALVCITAIGGFGFWLFPKQGAGSFVTQKLNGFGGPLSQTPFHMYIREMSPCFPLGVKCEQVSIVWDSGRKMPGFPLSVHVPICSLFKRPVPVRVEARPSEGMAKVLLNAAQVHPRYWNLEKVEVEDMPFSDIVLHPGSGDLTIRGYVGGRFDQAEHVPARLSTGMVNSLAGRGIIRGRDVQVDISDSWLALIHLPPLEFSLVDGRFEMDQGRVSLEDILCKGPVLHLSLSGDIHLANPLGRSRLALEGRVLPQSPYLAQLARQPLILVQFPDIARTGLAFHVKGTLSHPKTDLSSL